MVDSLFELVHELDDVIRIGRSADTTDELAYFAMLVLRFVGELLPGRDVVAYHRIEGLLLGRGVRVELVAELREHITVARLVEGLEERFDLSMLLLDQFGDVRHSRPPIR